MKDLFYMLCDLIAFGAFCATLWCLWVIAEIATSPLPY